jgi:hypothetical protein
MSAPYLDGWDVESFYAAPLSPYANDLTREIRQIPLRNPRGLSIAISSEPLTTKSMLLTFHPHTLSICFASTTDSAAP